MKRRHVALVVIVSASIFGAGIALAAADKYAVQSPSGISFSEFRGYEAWQTISVSQPDDEGGCGTSPAPGCIKVILGNPAMVKAYAEGIPANGKPVPDGSAFAKVEWQKGSLAKTAYDVTVPGKHAEVSFMLKDSKRFPKTNGWGYATFKPDAASETFTAFGDGPEFVQVCHGCHTLVKSRDFVFTDYSKR
jgi:cytochrome P460